MTEEINNQATNEETRPTCAVRGMIRPMAMCGHVIVGLKFCGYKGDDCPHKVLPKSQQDLSTKGSQK